MSTKAKQKTTALAKRAPAKKKSTTTAVLMPKKPAEVEKPPATIETLSASLDENISLGQFGLVELKFTPEEEAVLSRPVKIEDMRILPTGAVYLPHQVYTRWLNEAFGRTGWALRPASKPLLNQNTVVVPYLLMIHGKPVAFALGEQEYFDNNKSQSYGDALESTVASGLRRCCKHLGLALELWDRSFGEQFKDEYCVSVFNEKTNRPEWRRLIDPPFWWEKKTRREQRTVEPQEQRRPAQPVKPVAHFANATGPIGDDKVRKFWAIARRSQRSEGDIRVYLKEMFGYDSTKQITHANFDTIITALEHPGPLPGTEAYQLLRELEGGVFKEREPGVDDD